MRKLLIHPSKKYLMYDNGEPFFYLADTAWELFHRLNKEEADYYLSVRAKQGFNVIQAVALSEFDGLTVPNAYGHTPLIDNDPTKPDIKDNYDYWQHMDYIINKAGEYGLYIALLPAWGDKFNIKTGKGPEIFDETNARIYGEWIAHRYRDFDNIIWVLGGDRSLDTQRHTAIIDALGTAIKKVDPDKLMTFHPDGEFSSVDYVKNKDYIDFHCVQSGHDSGCYMCRDLLRRTGDAEDKPFCDLEPRYEDHPACFNPELKYFWDADDIRQNAYWAVMEGVCGHTYGNHCVWRMNDKPDGYFPFTWKDALLHDGANQMQYVLKLRLSRPYFELRPAPELIFNETAINAQQAAARGEAYAFVYSPLGQPIRVYLDKLGKKAVKVSWYNPRNGEEAVFGIVPSKEALFIPPTCGKGNDWVLIIDMI